MNGVHLDELMGLQAGSGAWSGSMSNQVSPVFWRANGSRQSVRTIYLQSKIADYEPDHLLS